ncbi:MAG: DNA methyltransferase, partial [Candidatus Methylumidiphilus sp.]
MQNRTEGKIYVVQTASSVIERCLLMTTDPGDLVLDPTCGSGTTAFVAEQWGRRWITMDTSRVALALAKQRLLTARFPYFTLRPLNADDLARNPKGVWLNDINGHSTTHVKPPSQDIETTPDPNTVQISRHSGMDRRNPDCMDASSSDHPWSLGSGAPCRNDEENLNSTVMTPDPRRTFLCKTVPHITLKSIARNTALDPIFARYEPLLAEQLAALNAALKSTLFPNNPPLSKGGRGDLTIGETAGQTPEMVVGRPYSGHSKLVAKLEAKAR